MAITHGVCYSFKNELMQGTHDFANDTIMLALYSASADIGPNTTAYTTSGEVSGANYSAGGVEIPVATGYPQLNPSAQTGTAANTVMLLDFDDVTLSNVSITPSGALIYNSSKSNRAIAVVDFGGPKAASAEDLTISFPNPTPMSAILRIF